MRCDEREERERKEKERRENVIHEVGAFFALCVKKSVRLGLSEIKPFETMPRKARTRIHFIISSPPIRFVLTVWSINVQMRRDRVFSDGVLTPQPRGFELNTVGGGNCTGKHWLEWLRIGFAKLTTSCMETSLGWDDWLKRSGGFCGVRGQI